MSNAMKKTAIVCAVILVIGLAVGGIGYTLGGVKGLDKIAEKHDWIRGSSGEKAVTGQDVDPFHSVEVTGNANVYLLSEEYFTNEAWLSEELPFPTTEADNTGLYRVVVVRGEKVPEPLITVENDSLKIEAKEETSGISIDFTGDDRTPTLLICCPEEKMSSIRVSVDTGDVMMGGITYDNATISTDTGDIETEHVIGETQTVETDTGDIDLNGTFTGSVEASSDTGDISFNTADFLKAFGDIDLKSDTGDISIEENGMDVADIDSTPAHYARSGEGTKLTMKTDTGELELSFGHLDDDSNDMDDEAEDD